MSNSDTNFRDKVSTVDKFGKRVWVYAKKPYGKYFNYRQLVGYTLLFVLFVTPFIKVNGEPLMLFNVLEGKFIILSMVFTAQDMHLFALMMLIFMVFIILFTVVFGRLFCGWVCPQTVFMEMVFRRIEYFIEGDANQQIKLNNSPWTAEKIAKKLTKHFIFFVIAVAIANIFLSYIIGVDQVAKIIQEPISSHFTGFVSMIVFSGLFYGVFSFFREQVCVAVCPYGRLQSVLLTSSSVVVIYDWIRGEPRGKKSRKETIPPKIVGDCVDCNLCVKVCPTGIDIRNGTQLECVNCTACMDACDQVMSKIGREEGLIRYDSYENIEKGGSKLLNKRVWAYCAVLAGLIILQSFLLFNRTSAELIIQRASGVLFQKNEDGTISNLYNYQIVNKTSHQIADLELRLSEDVGYIQKVGAVNNVEMQQTANGSFFVFISEDELKGNKNEITIELYIEGELIDQVTTNFLGPIKSKK
jgi:cytochrome c oxidase accessory protein FixG